MVADWESLGVLTLAEGFFSAVLNTVRPRHRTNNPKASRTPLRSRVRLSSAVAHWIKSRKRHGEMVNHIPATTIPYAQVVMTRRHGDSSQRALSTISWARSRVKTARPRTG